MSSKYEAQYAALKAAGAPAELVGSVGFAIEANMTDERIEAAIAAAWDGLEAVSPSIPDADLTYIADRLGTEATASDAWKVAKLAEQLAAEQGDAAFDLLDWLSNRTYDFTRLWEAANGDAAALAEVRAEAHLPVLS